MSRFSLKQKNVQNFPAGAGADFSANLQICHWHCDADAMVRKLQFHDYWASRGGRAAKMKKIAFSSGRCRKHWKSRSHAAWESKKKVIRTQHGNAKNDFCDTSRSRMLVWKSYKFLLLWILVNLGEWKSASDWDAVKIFIFLKKK